MKAKPHENKFERYEKLAKPVLIALIAAGIVLSLLSSNIILQATLFLGCFVFMVKLGQFIAIDADPVPFAALVIFQLSGYLPSVYFILITLPVIDIFSSRLNHFSLINFVSIILTLTVFYFLPFSGIALIYGALLFNVFRVIIGQFAGLGFNFFTFSAIHAVIYFVLGSISSYFLA